jgi:hypothetical protein
MLAYAYGGDCVVPGKDDVTAALADARLLQCMLS